MRGGSRLALRALAACSALILCADPLARVLHLHDDAEGHAWCEAHGHMVHLDEHGEAVGSDDVSEHALWNGRGGHPHGHHECPAVSGLRVRLAEAPSIGTPAAASVEVPLGVDAPALRADRLRLAPKHGPPAGA